MKQLILYSKPGCHLCEGLEAKLAELSHLDLALEIRDITTRPEWFDAYQYAIPVLCRVAATPDGGQKEEALPRLSPRAPVRKLEQMLQTYLTLDTAQ